MLFFLIVLAVLIAALFAVGYYVFTTVFDMKFKAKENNNPDFIDSDADLMRPTARRLYAYRAACHDEFSALPFRELEVTSFGNSHPVAGRAHQDRRIEIGIPLRCVADRRRVPRL